MSDTLKTYSVLIAWSDSDREQGNYGTIVRATDHDDAERKARADMRASHVRNNVIALCPNCGCSDNDGSDICPDCQTPFEDEDEAEICAEYEHTDLRGDVIFGGDMQECSEGAIWKAAELEKALRALLAVADERAKRTGWADMGEREAARKLIAEIDGIA